MVKTGKPPFPGLIRRGEDHQFVPVAAKSRLQWSEPITLADFLRAIQPLADTVPQPGLFIAADGSAWICAACAARGRTNQIRHKKTCSERAHWRAVNALRSVLDGDRTVSC